MTKKEYNNERQKRWRLANPERAKAILLRSLAKNREKRLARRRELYARNPEPHQARNRDWQARHPGYNASKHKEYRKKYPERYREYERRKVRNPARRRVTLRAWHAKKQATDLNWRILRNLRTRLYFALKGKNKTARTIELLGCSLDDFKIYIESLFEVGMSWENYGKKHGQWSLDHIVPCDLFDMTNPEHQKRCFFFGNLRPFWHVENLRKGAKHEEKIL